MFKGLRTLVTVGAVLVLLASIFRYVNTQSGVTPASASAAVVTTTVDRGDVAITVSATGNIQANQNIPLAFTSSGKVTAINVKVGDFVRQGQTIATIDDQAAQDAIVAAQMRVQDQQLALDKLNEKPRQVDIDVAQAAVTVAQQTLAESKISPVDPNQVAIAQANVNMAKNQFWQAQLSRDVANQKKAQALANPKTAASAAALSNDTQNNKAISSADIGVQIAQDQLAGTASSALNPGSVDSAQAQLTSAQVQLQALLAGPNADDVKQAQANLDAAKAALAEAEQTLGNTRLVAPFDGQIAQINLSLGQPAPVSQAVVLLDVSSFYVDLPVAELDIANIKVDQPVNLHFDSLPTTPIQGKVIHISDVANTGTPVTYNVRVQFDPAGHSLLSTMSTTASIVTSNAANVVRLPNTFIRIDRAQNKAYASLRQPDGTYKDVQLQLGMSNDTYTEIKSGLKVGDVVAVPTALGGGGFGGPGGRGGILPFGRFGG